MTEPAAKPQARRVSVLPYALFVPVLVVMAQSAWAVVRGWTFGYNALLSMVFHPIVLGGMAIIAVISYFVIQPFASRSTSRWVAFLACAAVFTIIIELLLPKLAV